MRIRLIILTVIGTVLPNVFVFRESIESGNILLYRYPVQTFQMMFANNVSSAFATDLLFVVVLFIYWTYQQSKKYQIRNYRWVWIYTFCFGIAGGLPLFLLLRHKTLETKDPDQ